MRIDCTWEKERQEIRVQGVGALGRTVFDKVVQRVEWERGLYPVQSENARSFNVPSAVPVVFSSDEKVLRIGYVTE